MPCTIIVHYDTCVYICTCTVYKLLDCSSCNVVSSGSDVSTVASPEAEAAAADISTLEGDFIIYGMLCLF